MEEVLAERVRSGEIAERIGAAKEIRRLTRSSPENRRSLSCAVGPLVDMLRSSADGDEAAAAAAALLALLNLAVKDEKNKIKIVEFGALDPLTFYLQSTNPNLQEYATAVILTLSASTLNKQTLTTFNIVPLLFKILIEGNKQAKTDSLMSLYNLSTLPQNVQTLLSLHPVPHLITLIRSCKRKSSKIAEKSCSIIEALVNFDQGRTAVTSYEGAILTIVEILEESTILGKEYAVGTLLTMCESDRDKYRELILKEGVIPGLLELTVHGTPKSRVRAHKLLELLRDSSCNRPRLQANTIENIVSNMVLRMDGEDRSGKAKKMVDEMVRVSMEQSLRHLKRRAFV